MESDEELDASRAAEVEWQKKRDKSRKIHLARDVMSMKEEVPPWINSVLGGQVVSEENIIQDLKSGETLLHCARTLQIIKSEKDTPGKTLLVEREIKTLYPEEIGDVGQAQIIAKHRSNLDRFVRWSKKIGVRDDNLFVPGDLVQEDPDIPRTMIQDRQVLNCMLRISKIMAPYGIEPPKSVKKEIKQDERRKTLKKQKQKDTAPVPIPVPDPPKEDTPSTPPTSPAAVVTPVVIERAGIQYYTFATAAAPKEATPSPPKTPTPPPPEVVTPPEELSVARQDDSLLYTTAEAVAFTTATSFFDTSEAKRQESEEDEIDSEKYTTAFIDNEITGPAAADQEEASDVPVEEEIPVTNIGVIYSDISTIEIEPQAEAVAAAPFVESDTDSSISEDEIIIDFAPAAALAAAGTSVNEQSRLSSTPLSDDQQDDLSVTDAPDVESQHSSRESPLPPTPDFTPDEPPAAVIQTTETVVNVAVVHEVMARASADDGSRSSRRSTEKAIPIEVQEADVFAESSADQYAQVNKLEYSRKSESFIKEKPGFNASAVLIGLLAFLVVGALVAVFSVVFTQN